MKYLKLFENFEDYNPYDLMVMFPDERLKLFIKEIKKPTSEQNLNLVRDLINLGTINTQDDWGVTALHFATEEGDEEITQMLIEAGADVNIQTNNGWTPLHKATMGGHSEIVQMLIGAGADVNVKDNWDNTPLHLAAYYTREDIAEMLVNAGADQTILNYRGLSWEDIIGKDRE